MRPLIGITCCYEPGTDRFLLGRDYVQAVQAGGGIPLLLPPNREYDTNTLLNSLDGLVLSGGGDIDPVLFGEEPWPENGSIDPWRDSFELALAAGAMAIKMPLLGICRGMQIINVAGGGTVCQDIGRVIGRPYKHFQEAPRWHPTHNLFIKNNSTLFDILGTVNLRVNSFHHQMVGEPAPGFKISARAGDGVIEAIETAEEDFFCTGVQFHPENMYREHPVFRTLFTALVVASTRFMSIKKPQKIKEKRETP